MGLNESVGNLQQHLNDIISAAVTAVGYEYLGCQYVARSKGAILRVYVDSPDGITVSDCERASRQISATLEVDDPILSHYNLEVSSPGLDRPLFKLEHYVRFIGHKVTLRLYTGVAGRRNFVGELLAVEGEAITLQVDGQTVVLPFTDIKRANIVPEEIGVSKTKRKLKRKH